MTIFGTTGHSLRAILLLTTAVLLLSLTDGDFARAESGGRDSGNAGNRSEPVSKPRALSNPDRNSPPAAQPTSNSVARDRRHEGQKPTAEPAEHDPLDR
jgi:hypothetical protein